MRDKILQVNLINKILSKIRWFLRIFFCAIFSADLNKKKKNRRIFMERDKVEKKLSMKEF